MFDITHWHDSINDSTNTENKIKEVNLSDLVLEAQWKKEYENCQDQWKRKVAMRSLGLLPVAIDNITLNNK
jgi:hypothetical protein